ncbi:hypothetical protein LPJ77_002134 [Coemansia sp. RSA 2523]|nr:hypothetical protein LPJ58_001906 [Coemansia sp. RSA 1591]KAJ1764440.1 hypothetical protein LPJ69_001852 [Coemansia sp. RSA 1752]KAJ1778510.1 hypothetical protein LPJ54_001648 [Coemansia sp. RSA 1824]KAJ1783976.1 hypothetical protein LPJ62_004813 [Coemansia sp. RSA 2167]KAJ1808754.1 hypothetical protein LPJ77_002134 [Coemansia sp. RSA 2523]KAJ2116773.1 hypothetical protein GGH17_005998 [Coemansia sp. RSA 788]KAJ2139697.1 hypothetical protein J3F82_005774 [Coemansia sp. RSA 637]KAJ2147766.
MATFFRFWTRQAEARPFVTVAATEACLSACGDLIAQTIGKHLPTHNKTEPAKGYDLWRTSRFVMFAMCVSPLGVKWHRFLDRRFPIRSQMTWFKSKPRVSRAKRRSEQKHTARQVGKRLACDVMIYEPAMYALFFASMAIMEGGGWEDAKYRVNTLLLPTYLTGLTISPIIQSINFAFVPLIYRVPFGSSFDLFWDSYLSWVNNEKLAMIEDR